MIRKTQLYKQNGANCLLVLEVACDVFKKEKAILMCVLKKQRSRHCRYDWIGMILKKHAADKDTGRRLKSELGRRSFEARLKNE